MDFMSINSIGSYIKNSAMQQKWQAKKKSGDFSADGKKTVGEWIESRNRKNDSSTSSSNGIFGQNDEDKKLTGIRYKMANGKKLTTAEKQYLKSKDPQAYQKLEEAEAEERSYKEELKKCRTKDDVQRLKFNRVAASLSTVKSVESNPNIPEGAKLGIIAGEQAKVKMISDATDRFVQSGRYADLPTDAEKREAEKLMKEAEEAEKQPENTENDAPAAENINAETENAASGIKQAEKAEAKETVKTSNDTKAEKISLSDKKSARAKAEQSPEVRRVKRARTPYIDKERDTAPTVAAKFETKA